MRCPTVLLWLPLVLSACGDADYPEAWPEPAASQLSRKGDCPDVTGAYDRVGSELFRLLGQAPGSEYAQPFWFEHRAIVTQAEDGSSLTISVSLNEQGLPAFREHVLKYNGQNPREKRGGSLTLHEGDDYRCSGGWLFSRHFPQAERELGSKRVSLQVSRDRGGSLIAGATTSVPQSIGWGGSATFTLGHQDQTQWYRWPRRDPGQDSRLDDAQTLELHRYSWTNDGGRIPVRISSFVLEPVCLRLVEDGVAYAMSGASGDGTTLPSVPCPDGWGQLASGDLILREFTGPGETPRRSRVDWFPRSGSSSAARSIDIPDASRLPMMPRPN